MFDFMRKADVDTSLFVNSFIWNFSNSFITKTKIWALWYEYKCDMRKLNISNRQEKFRI